MAGDFVKVDFGALADGQAALQSALNGLTSEVSTLQSQLGGSLGDWTGPAQTAYHQAQTIWNNAMADMQATISGLGGVVGTANSNYQSAENTNQQMFS
jgi:WXG100 family type VII secretion target